MLMALTVCVTVFFVLLPMGLIPWNSTFAIQTAFGPAPPRGHGAHFLRNPRACFPAARRRDAVDRRGVSSPRRSGTAQAVGRRGAARRRTGFHRLPHQRSNRADCRSIGA